MNILVTDTLFIDENDVAELTKHDMQVERLAKPDASENEIIEALKGKQGYILGGIEKVTERVIQSTEGLEWIIFTGTDYKEFIPGWELAVQKGIKIANVPGANADAVAEWAVGIALLMQRRLIDLGRTGTQTFLETLSIKDTTVGVLGMGTIGQAIVRDIRGLSPAHVLYANRSPKECSAEKVDLSELLNRSDIVFVALPKSAGCVLNAEALKQCKRGALIVSVSPYDLIDFSALLPLLQTGKLRAAIDWPAPSEAYTKLPHSNWYNSNDHAAYNTKEANARASRAAVEVAINFTNNDEDKRRVA